MRLVFESPELFARLMDRSACHPLTSAIFYGGSYSSALARLNKRPPHTLHPLTMSTFPLGRSAAVWLARGVVIRPVGAEGASRGVVQLGAGPVSSGDKDLAVAEIPRTHSDRRFICRTFESSAPTAVSSSKSAIALARLIR